MDGGTDTVKLTVTFHNIANMPNKNEDRNAKEIPSRLHLLLHTQEVLEVQILAWRPAMLAKVFSWFYSAPPDNTNTVSQIRHDHFLPHTFQLPPFHSITKFYILNTSKSVNLVFGVKIYQALKLFNTQCT
jgi:hypothetical protein